jgi:hypothetical protein
MKSLIASLGQIRNLVAATISLGAVLAANSAHASTTLTKSFEFGPGTSQTSSHLRTFEVPANSLVGVAVTGVSNPSGEVLVVEVFAPDAGTVIPTDAELTLDDLFITSSYSSPVGCPDTWKVRVRTGDREAPSAKVSGNIVLVFTAPNPSSVNQSGGNANIGKLGGTATRTLSGIKGKGLGRVQLKAKWHTDPTDLANFGRFFRAEVRLLRPNGTVAASETGYSQHAPSTLTPKVNFTYQLTAADLALSGDWKVKVINHSSANLVDFNLKSGTSLLDGLMNTFTSTFTPRCN